MKPDLYTKVLLTIIAGSLFLLATQNLVSLRSVSAQGTPPVQKVMLVDDFGHPIGGTHGISITGSTSNSIEVTIANKPSDPLDKARYPNAIPVQIVNAK